MRTKSPYWMARSEGMPWSRYFPCHYGGIGHGVGLFVHEVPFIRKGAEDVYTENVVTTIEPGLYIPGPGRSPKSPFAGTPAGR